VAIHIILRLNSHDCLVIVWGVSRSHYIQSCLNEMVTLESFDICIGTC